MTPSVPAAAAGAASTSRELQADRFLELVARLRRTFEARIPADVRETLAGATPNQLEALWHMCACGSVAMHDLARAQGIALSSATALADRLIRQGLAERATDPDDRRIVRLVPTDRARACVSRYREAKRQSITAALRGLDEAETEELLRLLAVISGDAAGRR